MINCLRIAVAQSNYNYFVFLAHRVHQFASNFWNISDFFYQRAFSVSRSQETIKLWAPVGVHIVLFLFLFVFWARGLQGNSNNYTCKYQQNCNDSIFSLKISQALLTVPLQYVWCFNEYHCNLTGSLPFGLVRAKFTFFLNPSEVARPA